jgi:NAD(P)-dependent dehydrogenase (short-subunit alcohol dehydrogenase family)
MTAPINAGTKTLVITGAASGFGLEFARLGATRGYNIVMADVEQVALDAAAAEIAATGVQVLAQRVDVSKNEQIEALAAATQARFGAPHWVFNNAGVGSGGLIWENTLKDWEWVMGVNVMGVVYGVKAFTPMMLSRAKAEPDYRGCIINTASMAGMLSAPTMGVYNVSKHAVVTLSETLYQDLNLVTDQVTAAVLCPYFVATGIANSHRNRPDDMKNDTGPTLSQLVAQAQSTKAVSSGKITPAMIAEKVFHAIDTGQFYIFAMRNPTDPFAERPDIGVLLKTKLRGA